MNYRNKIEQFADYMKNTYIRKDVGVKLALLKGKDDPDPKKTGFNFSITLNLAEAAAIGAGIALLGITVYECFKKSCETKVLRDLIDETDDVYLDDEE